MRTFTLPLLLILLAGLGLPASSRGNAFGLPRGQVFAGLTGGDEVSEYTHLVGKHPPIFQLFTTWGDSPGFVSSLFRWARQHGRTRMLLYNQGNRVDGPFRLWRHPASRRALRSLLRSRRFPAFAS
jgi:hypothetical protein